MAWIMVADDATNDSISVRHDSPQKYPTEEMHWFVIA